MNINKVLDYKGRALGAATFFVRFENFPWIFFFFSCHHVKCICVLFSFLLKKKKNVECIPKM